METPMTTRLWDLYFFWNSIYQGISVLQPWHQVAQKSRTTTFPLKAESCRGAPVASVSAKSGAGLRALLAARVADCFAANEAEHSARVKASAIRWKVLGSI